MDITTLRKRSKEGEFTLPDMCTKQKVKQL